MTTLTDPQPSTDTPDTTETKPSTEADASLFRVVWRWHFYAGIFVAPFLWVVALTGSLYLFSTEIMDLAHADIFFVEPTAKRAPLASQLEAAQASFPGESIDNVRIYKDPARTTLVVLHPQPPEGVDPKTHHAHRYVFVNPNNATIVASVTFDFLLMLFMLVLEIHRSLFLGTTGRIVTELATSWGIILFVSGIFLWWPRRRGKTMGIWWPRLSGKRYVVLRDLHALAGLYVSPVILVIAGTGLFYTLVWGNSFHFVSSHAMGNAPEKTSDSKPPAQQETGKIEKPVLVTLDEVYAEAINRCPERDIGITPPSDKSDAYTVFAVNDFARGTFGPMKSSSFEMDAQTGEVHKFKNLSEDRRFWWHAWTYPLHVGTIWGMTTKIIWFLATMVLVAMPITGVWMWWERRPKGKTGFPRATSYRKVPISIWGAVIGLLLFLPAAAISVLVILVVDQFWTLRRSQSKPRIIG